VEKESSRTQSDWTNNSGTQNSWTQSFFEEMWKDLASTSLANGSSNGKSNEIILRKEAFEGFKNFGWPDSKKEEEWKYTSFDAVSRLKLVRAPNVVSIPSWVNIQEESDLYAGRIVWLNGRVHSDLCYLPVGCSFSVSSVPEPLPYNASLLASPHLSAKEPCSLPAFTLLNNALASHTVTITVEKNCKIQKPVQLLFVSIGDTVNGNWATQAPFATFPRVIFTSGDTSECTFVERFVSDADLVHFTCYASSAHVGANAALQILKVQRESKAAYHWHGLRIKLARDARFTADSFSLGGRLVRNEVSGELCGENSHLALHGLSIADGEQHIDNSTTIDHAVPHCDSTELYKGIYGGRATGVFGGVIIVRPDAQKTNAFQSNKGLLLSDKATFNTRPQLTIWADDVKCTHGAAIGQLDDAGLFYLMARGISKQEAQGMLTHAFACEVVDKIQNNDLKALVAKDVQACLATVCSNLRT
jgi:Fe-S cluster assembly protein SufD